MPSAPGDWEKGVELRMKILSFLSVCEMWTDAYHVTVESDRL